MMHRVSDNALYPYPTSFASYSSIQSRVAQLRREKVRSSCGVAKVKLSLIPLKKASLVCPGASATL